MTNSIASELMLKKGKNLTPAEIKALESRIETAIRGNDYEVMDLVLKQMPGRLFFRYLIAEFGDNRHLDILVNDKNSTVRCQVSHRGRTQDFEKLRQDKDPSVRFGTLFNYKLQKPVNHNFTHESDFLGAFASQNPFLIKEALENLTPEIANNSNEIREQQAFYASCGSDY